jgi:hypothetical protein
LLLHFLLTKSIVDDPVIAKTVHTNTISRYHGTVHRSGIGFGPRYQAKNLEKDDDDNDDDVVVEVVDDDDNDDAVVVLVTAVATDSSVVMFVDCPGGCPFLEGLSDDRNRLGGRER